MIRPAAALIAFVIAIGVARAEPVFPNLESVDVLDARSGAPLTLDEFDARIRSADILLLGEVHDNPMHHIGQAAILRQRFANADRPVSVVFEMLPRSKQSAIDAYQGGAAGFADPMGWHDTGWPDAAIYQPVFDAAFALEARLIAGDLDRDLIHTLYSDGAEALPSAVLRMFRLMDPLPDSVRSEMTELQFQSHCELFPRERMAGMVTIQRARDAALAEAVADARLRSGGPVALIAGTGHVRIDHGAGALLRRALPEDVVLAIGFVERDSWQGAPAPYDLVIATDPQDRPDPCDALRKSHGRSGSD